MCWLNRGPYGAEPATSSFPIPASSRYGVHSRWPCVRRWPGGGSTCRSMHRLRVAAAQRMPGRQIAALGQQAIGAGRGQPCQSGQILGIKGHAVGDEAAPLRIFLQRQLCRSSSHRPHWCSRLRRCPRYSESTQTTFSTAVAQALPFRRTLWRSTVCSARTGMPAAAGAAWRGSVADMGRISSPSGGH